MAGAMRKQTTQIGMSTKCNKEDGYQVSNMIVIYENINTGHVCVCASALNYKHAHISVDTARYLELLRKIMSGDTPWNRDNYDKLNTPILHIEN